MQIANMLPVKGSSEIIIRSCGIIEKLCEHSKDKKLLQKTVGDL